ncbi:hypothetical protein BC834DRAFT_33195 [Gloeopeniophorella convolvens]|nr:hypothetical protein BC834DRAFT_33195 [Gloeopeniophorella convolvens]
MARGPRAGRRRAYFWARLELASRRESIRRTVPSHAPLITAHHRHRRELILCQPFRRRQCPGMVGGGSQDTSLPSWPILRSWCTYITGSLAWLRMRSTCIGGTYQIGSWVLSASCRWLGSQARIQGLFVSQSGRRNGSGGKADKCKGRTTWTVFILMPGDRSGGSERTAP